MLLEKEIRYTQLPTCNFIASACLMFLVALYRLYYIMLHTTFSSFNKTKTHDGRNDTVTLLILCLMEEILL